MKVHMRTVLFPILLNSACWASSMFGTWKMDAAKSNLAGATQPKSFTVRIEPHAKGEVFTLDRVDAQGRNTTSSTVLYLDGKPRDLELPGCAGTQSSRRLDSRTVEILRNCGSGESMRFVRRLTQPKELVLEITEQRPDGSRLERRLVLEKESGVQ